MNRNDGGPALYIYGGKCCQCRIGTPIGVVDDYGKQLHTGDIIQLWHGEYIGTDIETWTPTEGLSAIVANQFTNYSDGTITLNEDAAPFPMGIKSAWPSDHWRVMLVKSHADVIEGERWPGYGFNYQRNEQADAMLARRDA